LGVSGTIGPRYLKNQWEHRSEKLCVVLNLSIGDPPNQTQECPFLLAFCAVPTGKKTIEISNTIYMCILIYSTQVLYPMELFQKMKTWKRRLSDC
jgi:hypothetical protein